MIVTPLGAEGASDATIVIAYLALGVIAYLVYRLGELWFDRPIGVVAALIVLTRPAILDSGLRAYVDLPYMALVLTALVIETRIRRAGWPVLALLGLAGLLRPEAWLFSAVDPAYLVLERDPGRGALAICAATRDRWTPTCGDGRGGRFGAAHLGFLRHDHDQQSALLSFTATQHRVESLERQTGPVNLILHGRQALYQVMQRPGILGAAAGIALGLAFLRQRVLIGVVAAVLAGLAFAVLACAGLAIIPRYTMLASAVLCVFWALALLGWRLLPAGDPWRRRWQLIGAVVAVAFVVHAPQNWDDLSSVGSKVDQESRLHDDLGRLADSGAFDDDCRPISVTSDRLVPRLAESLDLPPSAIVIAPEQGQPSHGYLVDPANAAAVLNFGTARIPPRFRPVARNESWVLYARCA